MTGASFDPPGHKDLRRAQRLITVKASSGAQPTREGHHAGWSYLDSGRLKVVLTTKVDEWRRLRAAYIIKERYQEHYYERYCARYDRKKKADKYSGESVMGANGALYATSGANALDEATLRGMMPGRLARLTLSQGISCHGKKPSMQRVLGAASACAGGSVRDGGA